MKKKGQIFDLLYIGFILMSIAIVGMVGYKIVKEYNTMADDSELIDDRSLGLSQDYENNMVNMIDQLFIIILVGISIVTVVSSFFIMSHPVFYFFFVIILSVLAYINGIYANVYQAFSLSEQLSVEANAFVMIPHIMRYFPLVMLIISFVIAIIMSAKR